MPVAECFDVVGTEVFEVVEEHVGGFGEDVIDAADAHEEGAGEDHFLDPIDAFGEALVSVVRDGDHLDGEEACWLEDTTLEDIKSCWCGKDSDYNEIFTKLNNYK